MDSGFLKELGSELRSEERESRNSFPGSYEAFSFSVHWNLGLENWMGKNRLFSRHSRQREGSAKDKGTEQEESTVDFQS